MDGANEWQVFRRITVPLLGAGARGGHRHADDQRAEDLRPGLHHRARLLAGRRERARPAAVPVVLRRRQQTRASAARSRVLLLLLVLPVMLVQHPPAAEGGAPMTAEARRSRDTSRHAPAAAPSRRAALGPARGRVGGGVMRVFLILVGLFWLVPTVGLLLSSLRDPARHRAPAAGGRCSPRRPSSPSTATRTLLDNDAITDSLLNTVLITVPATRAGRGHRLAGRLRLRLDGLPRPRLVVPGRGRRCWSYRSRWR